MRPAPLWLLALCLAACSSDPSPVAPDASQPADVALEDAAPEAAAPVDAPADVAPADAVQVDAAPDVAAVDAAADAPRDTSAPPDAPRDAADPCGSSALRTCDVNGHDECVNIDRGRVLGGVLLHCGACGVMCAEGEVCAERRCQRL